MATTIRNTLAGLAVVATIAGSAPSSADAETVAQFFTGKTIAITTSTGAGGPFDITARTIARHMGRHIPGNPLFIVKNMPGGGHTLATNYMASQAPRDGTALATVNNPIPLHQAIGGKGVRYDARKFNWIGTTGISNLLIGVWHTTGIKTFADVMKREVVMGATGAGSGNFIYPFALNELLGTKFKIVSGYRSAGEIDLAMTRGEVQGTAGISYSGWLQQHPEWFSKKLLVPIAQIGPKREADFPDVPLMEELATNPDQRQILSVLASPVSLGRPFFAPPDVPQDRVAALRKAFMATMKDPAFVAEAKQQGLDLSPDSGERLTELVAATFNTRPDLLAKVSAIMGGTPPGKDAAKGKDAKN
jgi:tripartite-type tricarboxylate transporter receptor subunit TctC